MNSEIQKVPIKECGEDLCELLAEDFELEPMYFKWGFSSEKKMFLRSGVIKRLKNVQKMLAKLPQYSHWRLKIWDGYRTIKVQKKIFQDYENRLTEKSPHISPQKLKKMVEVFVAFPSRNPLCPPPHNTGGAIDLTLVDGNGGEINMGTKFDEFTEKARTNYFDKYNDSESKKIRTNRKVLLKIMSQAGFVNYFEEWWHFSYGDQAWAYEKRQKFAIYGHVLN